MGYTRFRDMRQINPCTIEALFDIISAGVSSRNLRILISGRIMAVKFRTSLDGVNIGNCEILSHFTKTPLIFVMFERFTGHAFNSKSLLSPYLAENSTFEKCES